MNKKKGVYVNLITNHVLKTRIHTLCRDIIAFKHNKIHQRIALVDCAIT